MAHKTHYGTVTEAIQKLREQGFSLDFNLRENSIVCNNEEYDPNDFRVVDVYRYEGNTDPGDEAAVYAIASKSGLKGILVTGYGPTTDSRSVAILEQLSRNSRQDDSASGE